MAAPPNASRTTRTASSVVLIVAAVLALVAVALFARACWWVEPDAADDDRITPYSVIVEHPAPRA